MIRKYEPRDDDAIIDVWYQACAVAHPFLEADFQKSEEHNIRTLYLPNTETWVADLDGQVVGFLSLIENEVGAIFLMPRHHGKGIGKAMMDKAVECRGALHLEVFKDNPIGRRFYARYGFVEGDERIHEPTGFPVIRLTYDPAP